MSKIPFRFIPVPQYFFDNGWLKNPNNSSFILWCFSRCSNERRNVCWDRKNITLEPYQFIFGRKKCSEETGLTENEIRTQQLSMESAGFLKKATNKTPNRFTIYEWSTEVFSENDHQQNHQLTTNRPPTDHHKQEQRTKILDYVCIVCPDTLSEEKKQEEEALEKIHFPHRKQNVISATLDEVKKKLVEYPDGFTRAEIEEALQIVKESEKPKLNGTIHAYIKGIILNTRKQKEIYARNNKSSRNGNKSSSSRGEESPMQGRFINGVPDTSPLKHGISDEELARAMSSMPRE